MKLLERTTRVSVGQQIVAHRGEEVVGVEVRK
jgi:hypothetical protein